MYTSLSKFTVLVLSYLVCTLHVSGQLKNYISLKQHSEILENKKKMASDINLYFDNSKLTITKHYYATPEFIMLSNAFGEIKTYYPGTNEVGFKHIAEMSSKRNLIYYFANNQTDHLGLADEGFSLVSNTYENQYSVTRWKAPSILKGIESVKMVFENGLPVYSEYQNLKKKVMKKIYYTNYQDFTQFRLPLKIIEISYLPSGDSVINRTQFSEVKLASVPENKYFNFKIPDNAKPIESTKSK